MEERTDKTQDRDQDVTTSPCRVAPGGGGRGTRGVVVLVLVKGLGAQVAAAQSAAEVSFKLRLLVLVLADIPVPELARRRVLDAGEAACGLLPLFLAGFCREHLGRGLLLAAWREPEGQQGGGAGKDHDVD